MSLKLSKVVTICLGKGTIEALTCVARRNHGAEKPGIQGLEETPKRKYNSGLTGPINFSLRGKQLRPFPLGRCIAELSLHAGAALAGAALLH